MPLIPLKAKFQNFLSFQDLQEFVFPKPGMNYIYGVNKDIDITEGFSQEDYSVGVGKTSLAMLIQYAFYGKIQKNINVDKIINKTTKKDLFVQLDFIANDELYRIERYRKHSIYNKKVFLKKKVKDEWVDMSDVDNKPTQDLINKIIVLDYRTFEKSMLFTRDDRTQFLELNKTDRGEIFENITQISRLQDYYDNIKKKLKRVDEKVTQLNLEITKLSTLVKRDEGLIEEQSNEFNIKIKELKKKLEELENSNISENVNIETIINNIQKYKSLCFKKEEINNTLDLIDKSVLPGINKNIENKTQLLKNLTEEEKTFIEHLKTLKPITCYNCGSIQNEKEFNSAQETLQTKIREWGLMKKEKEQGLKNLLQQLKEENLKYDILTKDIKIIDEQIDILDLPQDIKQILQEDLNISISDIPSIKERINVEKEKQRIQDEIHTREESYYNMHNKLTNSITINKDLLKQQVSIKDSVLLQRKMLEYWIVVLDFKQERSIKQYIISKVIPLFNQILQQIVDAVYHGSMVIMFDNFFNETIIFNEELTEYDELSSGEKAKLNFCINLSIFDLTRINLDGCNTIFMDEVFVNLDLPSIINMLNIIKERYAKNNSVNIISHQSEVRDNLDPYNIYRIEKKNNASLIFKEK